MRRDTQQVLEWMGSRGWKADRIEEITADLVRVTMEHNKDTRRTIWDDVTSWICWHFREKEMEE